MRRLFGRSKPAQPQPWDYLRGSHPAACEQLDRFWGAGQLTDVDVARLLSGSRRLDDHQLAGALVESGPLALLHSSGQRGLPTRFARHNLATGQVRLGRVQPDSRCDLSVTGDFAVDRDVLRTSMLVIGPPGSGKSRSVAVPIVEHLSLSALAGDASVVVIDPKYDDLDQPGLFDIHIDPLVPTIGFSLFGASVSADMAADRLASAMLPPKVSDDKSYFMDASKNALYSCLEPFLYGYERWPTIRELLALLRADKTAADQLRSRLKGEEGRAMKALLQTRMAQAAGRHDPAASLLERFALLDRPVFRRLFDFDGEKFSMDKINSPIRVHVALPEAEYPDASRILARLVVSQFVSVTSSSRTNRSIFKGLVIDEAGRYVDDYVARGIQRVRSNNAEQ